MRNSLSGVVRVGFGGVDNRMKVVAVIPVLGRLPLVKHTIERLLKKNGVHHVICCAETLQEKRVIEDAGGIFLQYKNHPLGEKWNAGFQVARMLRPDAVLFVGSSDWITDNWLPSLLPLLPEHDMVGTLDFYMADVSKKEGALRVCHWLGYQGTREGESIGIGRILSARILDAIDWQPFHDEKDHSMDFAMLQKVKDKGGKIKSVFSRPIVCDNPMINLSISTDMWNNKHRFNDHWENSVPPWSFRYSQDAAFELVNHFPELQEIFD